MINYKILLLAALSVLTIASQYASAAEFRRAVATLDDVHAASCRVNVSGARGSGTFIGCDGGQAYILTNYHVVTNASSASVDFWSNGDQVNLRGRVVWRYYDENMPADFALIAVDADELEAKVDPPFVALGGKDARPGDNSFIISAGAPKGRFVQSWRGRVVDYYNGSTALFQPPPVPGQSGSGIFEVVDGELFLVGVLTWLIGAEGQDSSRGGAIPVSNIYASVGRKPLPTAAPHLSPIPPGATECSNVRCASDGLLHFKLYELYDDECAACAEIESDVRGLQTEERYQIERVDVSSSDGEAFAQRVGVDTVPAFVFLDDNDLLIEVVSYEQIEELGVREALTAAYARAKQKTTVIRQTAPTQPAYRPPVYDAPAAAGLFDDSEERWRSRGRRESIPQQPSAPQPSIDEPVDGYTPIIRDRGANDANASLADRLAGRLAEGVGASIGGAIRGSVSELSATISAAVSKIVGAFYVFCLLVAFLGGNYTFRKYTSRKE